MRFGINGRKSRKWYGYTNMRDTDLNAFFF